MSNNIRWSVLVGALLLAVAVGFGAYQAGVAHGIEQSGKIARDYLRLAGFDVIVEGDGVRALS